jgi:molecular chaperone HscB
MQADLGKNYFELFGLEPGYDVDAGELAARYRELQRRFHPDRFASAPEAERRASVQMTAQINAAYQTLGDDVARGRYLLGLHGVSTDEETDTRMDPSFLMEQMELREALDEAHDAGQRERLRAQVVGLLDERTATLRHQLAERSSTASSAARATVREMQFLQKLIHEIDAFD